MTEREAKKELMRRALDIKPTVHVGQEGLKESVFEEISGQLKKTRLIKIRVLDNSDSDVDEVSNTIAEAVGGVVVDVRGGVVIMTDKRTWTSLSQKKF